MKPSAYVGDSAARMPGSAAIPPIPHVPIATNHAIITGPKNRPTTAVPWRCTLNNATVITAVIGTTQSLRSGSMVLSPSTAESIEMAGVIMESPKNRAAPNSPRKPSAIAVRCPRVPAPRRSSVISAMMPPSPWLSARITKVT